MCLYLHALDKLEMPLSALPDLQLLGSPAHQHWLPRMLPLPPHDRMCTWVREIMGRQLQRKRGKEREGGGKMGGKKGGREGEE